ncbi:MAG TPA: preprotein translocase subunit SecG [Anaerolineaceae bacterium]|nr:preprotein translocase subunit SecG [Anaerolineaceae bacterium]HNZ15026.1 preprotein translocase subunit SecG [Anaerolineaceae bacterium]HOH92039.1 preprotein translocase subunit SecG [Anaerolineaceae bacterium]HQC64318.1 preprotein translocase subunit SecG [Anaerolineaceae bacterium]
MNPLINISMIIVSIFLIISILLQSKGIGLGGLAGGDSGGVYTQRRGIEKVMFYITLALSVVFIILALLSVILTK